MEPLVALLSLALAGGIAQGPQTADPLTEERFLVAALGAGADQAVVAAASLDVGERRAALAAAGLTNAPEIALGAEDPGGDDQEIELALGWQPSRRVRRRLELAAARAELEAAEAIRDRQVALLRLDARESFAVWAVAVERLRSLDAEADLLAEATRRLGERVRLGEAAGLDHRRLRLAAVEVDARRAVARADAARAAARAAVWAPEVVSSTVTPALPELPAAGDLDHAEGDTPTVRALEAWLRATDAERRLADLRAELPALSAGWKQVDAGVDGSQSVPIVGLSWTVPLADRQAVRAEAAESRRAALDSQLSLVRHRAEAETRGATRAYEELRRAALRAAEEIGIAAEATEAARLAFELGEADLTTLLDTVRAATAARVAATELHGSALEASRELERIRLIADVTDVTAPGVLP